jgi:hypothetical protein
VATLIAMDSNSRSTVWHDNQTNSKGKTLEECLMSRYLHITNEESDLTTFQSRGASSNIDLTIVNKRLFKIFNDWEISKDESCSDHNIIKFKRHETNDATQHNQSGPRYIIKEQNYNTFDKYLKELVAINLRMENSEASLDSDLALTLK